MNKAFQSWKSRVKHECHEQVEGQEDGDRRLERERTYGIKNGGKSERYQEYISKLKIFCKWG
eukprot:5381349-Pleurochrysis_carterae.AAC.1